MGNPARAARCRRSDIVRLTWLGVTAAKSASPIAGRRVNAAADGADVGERRVPSSELGAPFTGSQGRKTTNS
jgi:hypothetical protein